MDPVDSPLQQAALIPATNERDTNAYSLFPSALLSRTNADVTILKKSPNKLSSPTSRVEMLCVQRIKIQFRTHVVAFENEGLQGITFSDWPEAVYKENHARSSDQRFSYENIL